MQKVGDDCMENPGVTPIRAWHANFPGMKEPFEPLSPGGEALSEHKEGFDPLNARSL